MKLIVLRIRNFKGIKSLDIKPDGRSISIYGDNATGKTTIADAYLWLLFDKDSAGTKNFIPKPKTGLGEDVHNVDTIVEGTYLIGNSEVTLKKVFSEVWKKKRGSATAEFTGHTVDYYIDGVPVKQSEYIARIESIAPIDRLTALTQVDYFSSILSAQERRNILLDIVGNISDMDVIAGNAQLAELKNLLEKGNGYYSVDEYHKITKSRLTEINNQLKLMPARIDEAQKAMPEEVNADEIARELSILTVKKNEIENKLKATSSEELSELKIKKSELKSRLIEAEAEHKKEYLDSNNAINEEIGKLTNEMAIAQSAIKAKMSESNNIKLEIIELKKKRDKLVDEYKNTANTQFVSDMLCPTCGQPLPENKIEEAKAAFNRNKSEKLAEINLKGKTTCSAEMIKAKEDEIVGLEISVKHHQEKLEDIKDKIGNLESGLAIIPPFEGTPNHKTIMAEMAEIDKQIDNIGVDTAKQGLQIQFDEISLKMSELTEKQGMIKQAESQKKRIEELQEEQKRLGEEYEKATQGLYLCEEFIKAKVNMLTDSINAKFNDIKFKLFDVQINGGIKEICEVLVPSENGLIPYQYANNAAKVNAGLDIIKVLSKHYGVSMPVFIDNAESVTALKDIGLQVIKLVVSANDKKIRME